MKNIIYIILSLLVLNLTTTSCEGFLDITPEGQVKRDPLLSTPEGIEDALYGVYSQLRSDALYGKELHFRTLEILSQTLWCKTDAVKAIGRYDWKHSSVISIFDAAWTEMYKNISNVNSILDAPLVADAQEYPFTIYKGEALGLRAFMHFDLVRLFAEQYTINPKANGIPYATEFSLKTPDFESLEKNYEHIIADLLEAEQLLADENIYENTSNFMLDRQIHFNLYAVQATLARVYLTMGKKDEVFSIPAGVLNIERNAFANTVNIKKVILPEGMTKVDVYAFRDCASVEEIVLPSTIQEILGQAFYQCTSLKTINLPEGLHTIHSNAFADCSSLQEVHLPSTLLALGSSVFSNNYESFI